MYPPLKRLNPINPINLFLIAVLFVIDPTGLSGEKSTIEAQLNVRKMLKERFPRRPWLDVISKGTKYLSGMNLD